MTKTMLALKFIRGFQIWNHSGLSTYVLKPLARFNVENVIGIPTVS